MFGISHDLQRVSLLPQSFWSASSDWLLPLHPSRPGRVINLAHFFGGGRHLSSGNFGLCDLSPKTLFATRKQPKTTAAVVPSGSLLVSYLLLSFGNWLRPPLFPAPTSYLTLCFAIDREILTRHHSTRTFSSAFAASLASAWHRGLVLASFCWPGLCFQPIPRLCPSGSHSFLKLNINWNASNPGAKKQLSKVKALAAASAALWAFFCRPVKFLHSEPPCQCPAESLRQIHLTIDGTWWNFIFQ